MKKITVLPALFVVASLLAYASPALAKRGHPPSTKPIISSFSASPSTINRGESSTLSWNVAGATNLTIDNGVGSVSRQTNKVLSPPGSTTYTLTATNSAGTVSATTSITVVAPIVPTIIPTVTMPPTQSTGSTEVSIQAYTTSYSYWDNTPVGSAAISNPILHQTAGGVGTYADPITIAVGHSIIGGKDILDYPAGTKFYIPNVRRYFIVEDTCGDGATPQNGPCHTGYPGGTTSWVDMWIDGASGSSAAVGACENFLTDTNGVAHTIVENPASNYTVVQGPVFQNGSCTAQFGNTAITI